jgi:hypothetical protein
LGNAKAALDWRLHGEKYDGVNRGLRGCPHLRQARSWNFKGQFVACEATCEALVFQLREELNGRFAKPNLARVPNYHTALPSAYDTATIIRHVGPSFESAGKRKRRFTCTGVAAQ